MAATRIHLTIPGDLLADIDAIAGPTLADTLIAATALEHSLALLIANPRHFP